MARDITWKVEKLETKPISEQSKGSVNDLAELGRIIKNSPDAVRFLGKLGLGKEDAAEAMRILKGR